MEPITRYQNAAEQMFNELDNLIEDIDPVVHEAAIGRYLLVRMLIDKAADTLLRDLDSKTAYQLILKAVADRFPNESRS